MDLDTVVSDVLHQNPEAKNRYIQNDDAFSALQKLKAETYAVLRSANVEELPPRAEVRDVIKSRLEWKRVEEEQKDGKANKRPQK